MILVFPMAGLSSRFMSAGFTRPKYMLPLLDYNVFYYVLDGFRKYFGQIQILFVYRNLYDTKGFIEITCSQLGLEHYQSIELPSETLGQAHTIALGLQRAKISPQQSLLIFNIDTFRLDFTLPEFDLEAIDGYLEVFEHEGSAWSFVRADASGRVVETAEKERISSLCSSGLYYFKRVGDFLSIFEAMQRRNERTKGEFYVAPMYNYLIAKGADIRYFKINLASIVFCGTPQEYQKCESMLQCKKGGCDATTR